MSKIILPFVFLLFLSSLGVAAPLFPEDGSGKMTKWYYPQTDLSPDYEQLFRETFLREDVHPIRLDFEASYLQDIAHFSQDGKLLILAPMPADRNILVDLTMAVFGDEDDEDSLLQISDNDALGMDLTERDLDWTFLEGGGVISGRFQNGEDYVILRAGEVTRTLKYYEWRTETKISEKQAKELIAKDLEIKPENIFVLPTGTHLDLFMQALPGEKILLQDSRMIVPVLTKILQEKIVPQNEISRLQGIIDLYKNQEKLMPAEKYEVENLDEIAKILSKSFQVVRVPGWFKEAGPNFIEDRINFFNGVQGQNPKNEHFVVTNHGNGLSSLENYWKSVLVKEANISSKHIHFVGQYGVGAGIDCLGAPAP